MKLIVKHDSDLVRQMEQDGAVESVQCADDARQVPVLVQPVNAGRVTRRRVVIGLVLGISLLLMMFFMLFVSLGITSSMAKANMTAAANRARLLYVGISAASIDRERAGLPSAWPKSAKQVIGDKDDIAGNVFPTVKDYFWFLFDMENLGTEDWCPYVNADMSVVLGGKKFVPRSKQDIGDHWLVLSGMTEELPDNIPVIVSANVDPKALITDCYDGIADHEIPFGSRAGRGGLVPWGDKGVVVVYKNGEIGQFTKGKFTCANLYRRQAFTIFTDVKYLDVR